MKTAGRRRPFAGGDFTPRGHRYIPVSALHFTLHVPRLVIYATKQEKSRFVKKITAVKVNLSTTVIFSLFIFVLKSKALLLRCCARKPIYWSSTRYFLDLDYEPEFYFERTPTI